MISSQTRSPGDAPPEGGVWDLPVPEATFAFVDLEMTGLRVEVDRIVEICIERVRGGELLGRLETVVDPGERRGAEHVHGLGDAVFAGAPSFAAIADEVVKLLDGAIVVAHGAPWDLAFLDAELGRLGRGHAAPTQAIDTLVLCRRAFHLPSYALQKVAASLTIPVARAHRAADDVQTLRRVFERLVIELSPKAARDLWDVRVGERVPRPEIVASLEAALAAGGPIELVYRPAHRAPERLTLVLTALVPPHAIGYLLPGRGRRELRIDRILRVEPGRPPEG